MPEVVVADASALAAILFDEDRADEAASQLEGRRLVAPSLLPLELANVAVNKARRAGHGEAAFAAALDLLSELEIQLVDVDPKGVFVTAMRTGLTAYDAAYLHLARALGVELVTFDERLRGAVDGE